MEPIKKTARIAGLLYLILILTGMFSLLYVPSELIVWDDAARTVDTIKQAKILFQMGIVSNLICFTCFIFLPLALYKLLHGVHRDTAYVMVILAVISVPISYVSAAKHIDVLSLLDGNMYSNVFGESLLNAKVMLLLEASNNLNTVAHIFWGLWLFPFGYLVYKSRFLPKFLGIMLMLGCIGYLIDFLGYFLFDEYGKTLFANLVGIPAGIGEIGICLWLLIVGIKTPTVKS